MNNVSLVGRLVTNPELRYTQSNKAYSRVTIAINRPFTNSTTGEREADFISCVFWNNTAEVLTKYTKKGHRIGVIGSIRTGSYDKEDGTKGYTTDVYVNHLEFLESKPKDDRPEPEYDGYDVSQKNDTEVESDPFADFGELIDNSYLD
ncbi:MAG: single-stranded DNA-binding protein [Bacilli bacterium]|nr:single-stranded DNA-binding protein [Bacilli bacterium]